MRASERQRTSGVAPHPVAGMPEGGRSAFPPSARSEPAVPVRPMSSSVRPEAAPHSLDRMERASAASERMRSKHEPTAACVAGERINDVRCRRPSPRRARSPTGSLRDARVGSAGPRATSNRTCRRSTGPGQRRCRRRSGGLTPKVPGHARARPPSCRPRRSRRRTAHRPSRRPR